MTKITRSLGLALILASPAALADTPFYLAIASHIVRIGATSNNTSAFSVEVAGGSGPCVGPVGMTFNLSSMPNADPVAFERTYMALLTAFTTGSRVAIASYGSASCDAASFVAIGG